LYFGQFYPIKIDFFDYLSQFQYKDNTNFINISETDSKLLGCKDKNLATIKSEGRGTYIVNSKTRYQVATPSRDYCQNKSLSKMAESGRAYHYKNFSPVVDNSKCTETGQSTGCQQTSQSTTCSETKSMIEGWPDALLCGINDSKGLVFFLRNIGSETFEYQQT
jgi:hypothetical protein